MSRAEKDLERMLAGRHTGWSCKDLQRMLAHVGYKPVSQRGSHRTWKHYADPKLFTFPDHGSGELDPGYIQAAARRIRDLRLAEGG